MNPPRKTADTWKRVVLWRWRFINRAAPFNATLHLGDEMKESRDFVTERAAREWAASHQCHIADVLL